ncbi:MAG: hypothetical protein N2483_02890, partial [Burkholderiaceae bacterium]|nr:hypothetical protein [Burkholderiaceae bacterium]
YKRQQQGWPVEQADALRVMLDECDRVKFAGNLPDDGGYAARVLAEHARLRLAASGKPDAALAAAMRAAAAMAAGRPAI